MFTLTITRSNNTICQWFTEKIIFFDSSEKFLSLSEREQKMSTEERVQVNDLSCEKRERFVEETYAIYFRDKCYLTNKTL